MKNKTTIFRILSVLAFCGILLSQFSMSFDLNEVHDTDATDQTELAQFSPKTISQGVDFHFDTVVLYFPELIVCVFPELNINASSVTKAFFNSYFSKLFEHHIAINAP